MSVTDPADQVQPDQGQGEGQQQTDPPYAEYLNRIPEEARGVAEEAFKGWDADVTRRFQEASEYRKQWEPYEGVKQYDPEAVQNALAFYQAAANNPQAIKDWYEQQYAPAHNLQTQPEPAQPSQPAQQDQFGQEQYGMFDQGQQLQQLLEQQLSPLQQQLEQLSSWRQQQEEATQLARGQQVIDQQIAELKDKHGAEFNQEWVEVRANHYVDTDPENAIPRAWADYQALVNQIQKQAFQSKADAPAPAESGGVPDVNPPKIRTLKEAEQYALAQLRGQT